MCPIFHTPHTDTGAHTDTQTKTQSFADLVRADQGIARLQFCQNMFQITPYLINHPFHSFSLVVLTLATNQILLDNTHHTQHTGSAQQSNTL